MFQDCSHAQFHALLKTASSPFLIDLWAPWCTPCAKLHDALQDLASVYPQLLIYRINADDHPQFATDFQTRSIPALFLFKDGVLMSKKTGSLSSEELLSWVQPHF